MAKNSGSKGRSKQRRKTVNRTAPESASRRTKQGMTGSAGKESAGSRLLSVFNSPLVRNVLAAGLVSAAGALIYNKRGGGDDAGSDDTPQGNALASAEDTAQPSAPKRRRRVAAKVSKAATQVV